MKRELEKLQKDYMHRVLNMKDLPEDPLSLFKVWMDDALKKDLPEPNAMSVSTVNSNGKPSSRTVLLKEFNSEGLVFYTNYNSRKAKEISENPDVSVLIFWPELERQVRIEGHAAKISEKDSDEYFASRPRASQIGAWASPQSETIESRKELEKRFSDTEKKYEGKEVPRPSHWGGFRIIPSSFEFWQGSIARLNDRIVYFTENGSWLMKRLAP
ncbi:MAG: pyridoxamine 5'-phosphate oxidase [Bacteroidota bacterium]